MQMTEKDCALIARSIWRARFIKDKNKVRQKAKEDRARLIVFNVATDIKQENPRFDKEKFYKACGLE
jgi:hypothetical protein